MTYINALKQIIVTLTSTINLKATMWRIFKEPSPINSCSNQQFLAEIRAYMVACV